MFIVYLNVCLDIAIRIFIGMVKKTRAENFSSLRPCYTVQFFLQLAMQFYS
jgi:hypothetical protein